MRTIHDWFAEYNVSHRNPTNKKIHFICVPLIFFSIIGILRSVPIPFAQNLSPYANFGVILILFGLLFYAKLSIRIMLGMLLFSVVCLVGLNAIEQMGISALWSSIVIFIVAWIGQFYGHRLEGKKPSFLKDVQFLLIGPAWVMSFLFQKIGIKY